MSHNNDFSQCLQFSHEAEDLPVWKEVYQKAFPDMVGMVSYRQDGFWQREGIDRGVLLKNAKQIYIDEKVRGRNERTGKVYNDVAMEYVSNDRTGAAGWAVKPLRADYIAYMIAPLGICYLLPVVQMQNAWKRKADEWIKKYGARNAVNEGYTTLFCPVPADILFPAIGAELRVYFDPFETKGTP
jgi:hypothetical protein